MLFVVRSRVRAWHLEFSNHPIIIVVFRRAVPHSLWRGLPTHSQSLSGLGYTKWVWLDFRKLINACFDSLSQLFNIPLEDHVWECFVSDCWIILSSSIIFHRVSGHMPQLPQCHICLASPPICCLLCLRVMVKLLQLKLKLLLSARPSAFNFVKFKRGFKRVYLTLRLPCLMSRRAGVLLERKRRFSFLMFPISRQRVLASCLESGLGLG